MGTTVVIPQRNRGGARLWNCLNALKRQTVPPEEVIVSDLSSVKDQLENIRGVTLGMGCTFLRVKWIRPEFSRAVACNCGIRASRSLNVVLLDVDVVAAPHLVETLQDRLEDAMLLLAEHRRGRAPQEGEDLSSDWGAYFLSALPNRWPRCAAGMFMAARRSFWATLCGVDERFLGWGAEDDHVVWKAEILGKVDWIDDPIIIHQEHSDVGDKGLSQWRNQEVMHEITRGGPTRRTWGVHQVEELIRTC